MNLSIARDDYRQPPVKSLLSIGQIMAKLKLDFPDVTPSKLRFLEDQGLITPARTASGYRKFSIQDLDRLKLILSLQRDNYLPLKIIRKYLDDFDRGLNPVLPNAITSPINTVSYDQYSKDDLVKQAGANSKLIQEAISANLLPNTKSFDENHLIVLKVLVELSQYGIEPRHLKSYRSGLDREVDLIESVRLPFLKRGDLQARKQAETTTTELLTQFALLRATLIGSALGNGKV